MKATTNSVQRRRLLLAAGLLFTLWATWQVSQDAPAPQPVAASAARRVPAKAAAPSSAPALLWPERAPAQGPITDLFGPAAPVVVAAASSAAPAAPPKPVFKFKYIGHLLAGDNSHAFLADEQDHVSTVKVGQTVGDEWQLSAMTDQQLVFRHSPDGQEHTLQIGTVP